MYYDPFYILLLPAVLLALIASASVNSTFRKYGKVLSSRRITGAEAAERVLRASGVSSVRIERISGDLTDHYDPKSNVIRLSESVYGSTSVAAIGVACHEAGHAIQHDVGYLPIRLRNAIVPVTNVGSKLAMPLILIGLLFGTTSLFFANVAYLGVACFALSTVFQLITLPTEFNASRRALEAIEREGLLGNGEIAGARKVLRAAAMTYVAALAVSLVQLLRFFLLVSGSTRRRR